MLKGKDLERFLLNATKNEESLKKEVERKMKEYNRRREENDFRD